MDNTFEEKIEKMRADIKKLNENSEKRIAKMKKFNKIKIKLPKDTTSLPQIGESIQLQEKQLTSISAMLAKHDYEIRENLATKNDLRNLEDRLLTRFDEIIGLLKEQKQELIMVRYRTQENTEDIKHIKNFIHLT